MRVRTYKHTLVHPSPGTAAPVFLPRYSRAQQLSAWSPTQRPPSAGRKYNHMTSQSLQTFGFLVFWCCYSLRYLSCFEPCNGVTKTYISISHAAQHSHCFGFPFCEKCCCLRAAALQQILEKMRGETFIIRHLVNLMLVLCIWALQEWWGFYLDVL